jgi:hypothetical protein
MFASTCRSGPKNLSTRYIVKMYSLLIGCPPYRISLQKLEDVLTNTA